MKTLLIVDTPTKAQRLQQQMDPSPKRENFVVISAGSNLAGHRFERIIVSEAVMKLMDPRHKDSESVKKWYSNICTWLNFGGKMITL